jgi:hypothetical protein
MKNCKMSNTCVSRVHEAQESDGFFLGIALVAEDGNKCPFKNELLKSYIVNEGEVKFKIDSGAQCNILSINDFKRVGLNEKLIKPCTKKVLQLDHSSVPVVGRCPIHLRDRTGVVNTLDFVILGIDCAPIIGLQSSMKLNLIQVNNSAVKVDLNVICTVLSKEVRQTLVSKINSQFSKLFDGNLGTLPGVVSIELKENSRPFVQAARRIPLGLHKELKNELQRMVAAGVIEPITKPTKWVTKIVIVRKRSNKIRICVDPRELNKCIMTPKFQLPTFDEIKSRMGGAKVFTILDASSGFWMMKLDERSSELCTIITPFGRFVFRRMPFGVASAPELFHRLMAQIFENMEGTCTYLDDICIWGSSVDELYLRVIKVLEVSEKWNKI